MKRKKYRSYIEIPQEELKKYYYEEKLSLQEIAAIYYVSHPTVLNRMKEYGMEKRGYKAGWNHRSVKHI